MRMPAGADAEYRLQVLGWEIKHPKGKHSVLSNVAWYMWKC